MSILNGEVTINNKLRVNGELLNISCGLNVETSLSAQFIWQIA
jgi:hypothetical protein